MDTENKTFTNVRHTVSSARMPMGEKLYELSQFFGMRTRELFNRSSMDRTFANISEYEQALIKYSGRDLKNSKALEIGFGARPIRLFALASLKVDVFGVDLDMPLIRGSFSESYEIYRRNGVERAIKSLVRFMLFDSLERRRLAATLRKRGSELRIEPERLLVQDAVTLDIQKHTLDFIYSEDVFEHIPHSDLTELIPKMAAWLKPNGLALIRPCIFTGIAGGHRAEWFPHLVESKKAPSRRSEPWEHLRKQRFQPTGYLNKLSRAQYRALFQQSFEILEERVWHAKLGQQFLTPEISKELEIYDDEELFSNQVLLRPYSN